MPNRMGRQIAVMIGVMVAVVAVPAVAMAQAVDEAGRQINRAFDANKRFIVTVSYSRMMDAGQMGQQDTGGSLTGVLVDPQGIVMVSGQDFFGNAGIAGLTRMMGAGESQPTNFRVRLASGTEFAADFLGGDRDANIAFVRAKLEDGMTLPAVRFDPIAVAELQVGQPILMIGTYPDFLNHARKFHLGRVNAIIDARAGLIGVDGPAEQCVGGLVVTMDGRPLGTVASRTSPQANPAAGGIGRIIRGVTSGGEGIRTCIISTPSNFTSALNAAKQRAAAAAAAPATPARPADPTTDPHADMPRQLGLSRAFALTADALAALRGMGLALEDVAGGVLVAGVTENSAFADAGLQRRDLILEVNGVSLNAVTSEADMPHFTAALAAAAEAAVKSDAGTFTLKIWNTNGVHTLTVRAKE